VNVYFFEQAHVRPQLQTSPHRHSVRRSAAGFWQPQVQVAPAQDPQRQALVFLDI